MSAQEFGTAMQRYEEPQAEANPEELSAEPKPTMERLNFNVSPAFAVETRQLANSLNISMTQLFKFAMSVFKIAVEEGRNGRKLVIADKKGRAIREFVLPGLD